MHVSSVIKKGNIKFEFFIDVDTEKLVSLFLLRN